MRRSGWILTLLLLSASLQMSQDVRSAGASYPGNRVLLDAHNCYPYGEWWADRIDRALSNGTPLAIEQDLAWYTDPRSGRSWSVLSHSSAATGSEPTMKEYFFERVRAIVERALREGDRSQWPIITLNLDLKSEEPEHLRAIRTLLTEYKDWISSAERTADLGVISPLEIRPLLVLTGESNAQKAVLYDEVPVGGRLLVFGATPGGSPKPADNYHRWWNNPWRVVEPEGQNGAGEWSQQDEKRLNDLVRSAHQLGLWIRFYTLDGESKADESRNGWFHSYNFGSLDAARLRWRAAIRAGADYIAVDQYEEFAKELYGNSGKSTVVLEGSLTHVDYERLFEREFDVVPGTQRLKISLKYTGEDRRTVIDLGLKGPAGFRGWSGGGPQTIVVGPTYASYGYLPGPVEPGRWAVVLGVPNIREGSTDTYSVTVEQLDAEEPVFPVLWHDAGWFTGDLHSHSGHSDGRARTSGGSEVKIPPHRVFDAARQAGLDFIALSDHNTPSHWMEVERLQPYYDKLLLLHAREITTYNGHLNAFGERRFVDFRVSENRTVSSILNDLAEGSPFLSINHPALPDDETCMGCGWKGLDQETMRRVNGIEVVNKDRVEGPFAGWPIWANMLNNGFRLTAVGGSDDHTADDPRDGMVGIPATVIYARELSEPALLEGLRNGRAYVRVRGPKGPALEFQASSAGGVGWKMGDTIPNSVSHITLSARLTGAAGQTLQWIHNGTIQATARPTGAQSATLATDAKAGDWFSVVLRDNSGPTLFSNAIYIAP
jgi:hypothetical protein